VNGNITSGFGTCWMYRLKKELAPTHVNTNMGKKTVKESQFLLLHKLTLENGAGVYGTVKESKLKLMDQPTKEIGKRVLPTGKETKHMLMVYIMKVNGVKV
jgi:hypothetical protein